MINNKKIIIGVATMNTRKDSFIKVMNSLECQTVIPDEIIIYNNDENVFNATDNGKFAYFENNLNEDVYFFSIDDDILYPVDYIEKTIKKIEEYKCIITYHGRILKGKNLNYYREHTMYGCLQGFEYEGNIDVCGTGVTAFDTSYFKPTDIFKSEYKRMSDCVFSLNAHAENKNIKIIKHDRGWFKDICTDLVNSCHTKEKNNPNKQIEICNKIIDLKKINNLVSIIIPYNKDRGYLNLAIESIENQTYKNIEIILSKSDNYVGYNFNKGVNESKGKFIKYVCDDDLLTSNSIEDSINFIKTKNYDFIHGNAINFFENGEKILYKPEIQKPTLFEIIQQNHIHGGTLFYNREVFDKYGLWDESLWTAEEYDYNLKLIYNNAKFTIMQI